MVSRTVFFRPRPFNEKYGTEWIPYGPEYRPFHAGLERIPTEASEKREFDCSSALESRLIEFHKTIRPITSAGSTPPLHASPADDSNEMERVGIAGRFASKVSTIIPACVNALPPEAPKVVDADFLSRTSGELIVQLQKTDIFSMQSELIELRVWLDLYLEIVAYMSASSFLRVTYLSEWFVAEPRKAYISEWQRRKSQNRSQSSVSGKDQLYHFVTTSLTPFWKDSSPSSSKDSTPTPVPSPRAALRRLNINDMGWGTSTSAELRVSSLSNSASSPRSGLVRRRNKQFF
ncbi:hypothetical protein B0H19DRAFT_1099308 [Mycena capillaripes]|nr:hypothetical protein B0H19DRAFT_1099308 [Mycena capillaripes]